MENLEKSGDERGEGSGVGSARTLGFEDQGGGAKAPRTRGDAARGAGGRDVERPREERAFWTRIEWRSSLLRAPTADASRHAPLARQNPEPY